MAIQITYAGATATTITVTLTSLGSGAARQSAAVDNTSNRYLDAEVRVTTKGASAANVTTLDVYAYGAAESTTPVYTDGASGSDAAFTAANRLNAVQVGQVVMNGTTAVTAGPWSLAQAFGGNVPQKWGLIFVNNSGDALSATAGDHVVVYQGITASGS